MEEKEEGTAGGDGDEDLDEREEKRADTHQGTKRDKESEWERRLKTRIDKPPFMTAQNMCSSTAHVVKCCNAQNRSSLSDAEIRQLHSILFSVRDKGVNKSTSNSNGKGSSSNDQHSPMTTTTIRRDGSEPSRQPVFRPNHRGSLQPWKDINKPLQFRDSDIIDQMKYCYGDRMHMLFTHIAELDMDVRHQLHHRTLMGGGAADGHTCATCNGMGRRQHREREEEHKLRREIRTLPLEPSQSRSVASCPRL